MIIVFLYIPPSFNSLPCRVEKEINANIRSIVSMCLGFTDEDVTILSIPCGNSEVLLVSILFSKLGPAKIPFMKQEAVSELQSELTKYIEEKKVSLNGTINSVKFVIEMVERVWSVSISL